MSPTNQLQEVRRNPKNSVQRGQKKENSAQPNTPPHQPGSIQGRGHLRQKVLQVLQRTAPSVHQGSTPPTGSPPLPNPLKGDYTQPSTQHLRTSTHPSTKPPNFQSITLISSEFSYFPLKFASTSVLSFRLCLLAKAYRVWKSFSGDAGERKMGAQRGEGNRVFSIYHPTID